MSNPAEDGGRRLYKLITYNRTDVSGPDKQYSGFVAVTEGAERTGKHLPDVVLESPKGPPEMGGKSILRYHLVENEYDTSVIRVEDAIGPKEQRIVISGNITTTTEVVQLSDVKVSEDLRHGQVGTKQRVVEIPYGTPVTVRLYEAAIDQRDLTKPAIIGELIFDFQHEIAEARNSSTS